MTLCPIALTVGCKKCPAFSACPLKGVIGDYRKQEQTQTKQPAEDKANCLKRAQRPPTFRAVVQA